MNVRLKNISKVYGDFLALNKVNISLSNGETYGLLGVNGAGKSTIIKVISGMARADSGEVSFSGKSISKLSSSIKKNIGIVPQNINLIMDQSVFDNLFISGRIYGLTVRQTKEQISIVSERLGIQDKLNVTVSKLSKGYQQKVLIARALIHLPKFLIMDEPTVGLDPYSRSEIWELIKDLKGKHTILLTTQYIEEADLLCDTIGIIQKGTLVCQDSLVNLKSKKYSGLKENQLLLELKDSEDRSAVYCLLDKFNVNYNEIEYNKIIIYTDKSELINIITSIPECKMKNINIKNTSLEDVFFKLTKKIQ